MASMLQDFEKIFRFLEIFVFLVPLEILSNHPILKASIGFEKN